MLAAIGLNLVVLFALPLAIIGAFVALAVIGYATNIITGLAVTLQAAVLPVIVISASMWIAYSVDSGLYGVAFVAAALLSIVGIVVAVDSYGPTTDNAGGIAEVSELLHEVRSISGALDPVGNTTKAVTKGYAIGSAATTTSMGRWPTGMVRSMRPVLSSRTLTVSLTVLAMKTWPLASSTSASRCAGRRGG